MQPVFNIPFSGAMEGGREGGRQRGGERDGGTVGRGWALKGWPAADRLSHLPPRPPRRGLSRAPVVLPEPLPQE